MHNFRWFISWHCCISHTNVELIFLCLCMFFLTLVHYYAIHNLNYCRWLNVRYCSSFSKCVCFGFNCDCVYSLGFILSGIGILWIIGSAFVGLKIGPKFCSWVKRSKITLKRPLTVTWHPMCLWPSLSHQLTCPHALSFAPRSQSSCFYQKKLAQAPHFFFHLILQWPELRPTPELYR